MLDFDGKVLDSIGERIGWQRDLPLRIFEDPALNVPGNRAEWLSQWHTDVEWLHAVHRTHYSNGVIGLHEALTHHPFDSMLRSRQMMNDCCTVSWDGNET
jgi:hypothetical protein